MLLVQPALAERFEVPPAYLASMCFLGAAVLLSATMVVGMMRRSQRQMAAAIDALRHCPTSAPRPAIPVPAADNPENPLDQLAAVNSLPVPPPLQYATPMGRPRPVTIERTSKIYKAQMLLAGMSTVSGFILMMNDRDASGEATQTHVGTLALVGGVLWWLIARFGAWWDKG